MLRRFFILIFFFALFQSCSKDKVVYEPSEKVNPFELYKEGLDAFDRNEFFFASKKFSEAELNFDDINLSAKAAIMSSFSLYAINFFDQAIDNLDRYLKTYPSDKNVIYAEYLKAIVYYEQIRDEKKDLKPLIEADKNIDYFIDKYPNSEYATDLKFKKDLIQNQLAAKELFVAKYYISTQKWIPAINRLKIIVEKFDQTIFIEEALHRLVEVNYHIGLNEEAENYAKILGYNYNSSKWFEQSYKILNKNYEIQKINREKNLKEDSNFFKRIIKMIK